jgi:SnoaL-like domain
VSDVSDMNEAAELEAIRQLKYAYFRTLDLKEFDALGALLTDDATASYEDGRTVLSGRAAIVEWLSGALSDPGMVTEHHGHHPEITFTSSTEAEGTWYLQDRVIVPAADLEIGGTAFYRDRYLRTSAGWRIAHTGYVRVFEERRTHTTLAVRSFTSRFGSPG